MGEVVSVFRYPDWQPFGSLFLSCPNSCESGCGLCFDQRGTVVPTVLAFLRWGPTYHYCLSRIRIGNHSGAYSIAAQTLASPAPVCVLTNVARWSPPYSHSYVGDQRTTIAFPVSGLVTIREPTLTLPELVRVRLRFVI